MEWLETLLFSKNIAHTVFLYALVISGGVLLGKIRFFGISFTPFAIYCFDVEWNLYIYGIHIGHLSDDGLEFDRRVRAVILRKGGLSLRKNLLHPNRTIRMNTADAASLR